MVPLRLLETVSSSAKCDGTDSHSVLSEIHLVCIVSDLKSHIEIFQILRQVTISYLRVLGDVIVQDDSARLLIVRRVLTCLGTKGVRLLPLQVFLQISHPLKTSGHVLLKDWAATTLMPRLLRGYSTDKRQHGMTCSYLSSKPSLT
ncbi:hypothetical protein TNCV_3955131 [Trichonephila clavipes]|nr:hypothetical protein TNCV_3955131 [Trichonephila clavipes]